MSLILNGTTITSVNINGTSVQSLVLNGTTAFSAIATVTATYATTNGSRWNLNGSDAGIGKVGDNFYTAGVTPNAYRDANAKSVGIAQIGSVIGVWDGTYWKPQGDTTKVLSGDFKVSVPVGDIGGVSGNGLIYTGGNAPFNTTYSLVSQFGVGNWTVSECNYVNKRMNNTNICVARKMFLPIYSETKHNNTAFNCPCGGGGSVGGLGVPALTDYSWTSTSYTASALAYFIWSIYLEASNENNDFSHYVRCVR